MRVCTGMAGAVDCIERAWALIAGPEPHMRCRHRVSALDRKRI